MFLKCIGDWLATIIAVLLYKRGACEVVMIAICQKTVSSTTNNGDWFECVDETQSHMKPTVVPERLNLTW